MPNNPLSELAKLALGSTQNAPAADTLVRAMDTIRGQTGAISALVFYGDRDGFSGAGAGDQPDRYPTEAIAYLQQRLVQLRVPLAFNLIDGEVQFLTRAATKQRRDYIGWLIPAADSWTELLILRGSWPSNAVPQLLEFVDSAMPALTIILERFVGVGRAKRLEQQRDAIQESVDALGRSAALIGSVAAVYPTLPGFSEEQITVLRELAERASFAMEELRANRDLMQAHLKLQEYTSRLERAVQLERQHATTDSLTGLLNHRAALQALEESMRTAATENTSLSLLVGDIDGFKLFNDTYGHVAGDDVLRLVAAECRKAVDASGTVCRYGGDEFLVILPDAGKEEATRMAEEIADHVGRAEFRTQDGTGVPIRMSIGVASCPEDTTSPSKLLVIADSAMYEAKKRLGADRSMSVSSRSDTTFGVLESLVLAVDAKDRYTKDHCDIVAEYAAKLAQRLQLSEESARALRIAGLLHDIGKLAVPDDILKKPAPLSPEEYEVMQRHVRIGEVLIKEVPQLNEVVQAVSCHHERFDGTGYPRGLAGDEIPLLGRIIAVADAFSAMCLDRPYRKALPLDTIIAEFIAGSGIQFDPDLSHSFVDLLLEEQIQKQRVA